MATLFQTVRTQLYALSSLERLDEMFKAGKLSLVWAEAVSAAVVSLFQIQRWGLIRTPAMHH